MSSPVDRLIKKSIVARDFRGVTSRQLYTLIQQQEWPPPDVKATQRGEADYYFESTALEARKKWLLSRGAASPAQRASEEIGDGKPERAAKRVITKPKSSARSRSKQIGRRKAS